MGTAGTILVVVFTAVLTWIGHAVLSIQQRKLEVEKALDQRRRQLYNDVVDHIFVQIVKAGKSGAFDQESLGEKFLALSFDMGMFASDEVVSEFLGFKQMQPDDGPRRMLYKWGSLMVAMRKDLGSGTTRVRSDDMLRLFITDLDEHIQPTT